MRTEPVNNLNFNGIYKLKFTKNGNVKTKIFQENNENYMYVITTEGKLDETIFEKDLRDIKVPFWKALSINSLLNKSIVDNLFDLTKKKQGKENWII